MGKTSNPILSIDHFAICSSLSINFINMIGKELDYLFKPHSKTLKSQFKKKFWTKGAPQ